MRSVIIAALLLGLAGCSGTVAEVGSRRGTDLEATPTAHVAEAYGEGAHGHLFTSTAPLRAELERRSAFTPEEWAMIDAKEIRVGASEELVLASWGSPDRTRRGVSAYGGSTLWVYEHDNGDSYVWLEGGRVVAAEN